MLIVDTNQVGRMPRLRRNMQRQVCLSEFVLAEILLRGEEARRRTLRRLRDFSLRIGVQPGQVLDEVAGLDEVGIQRYRPLWPAQNQLTRTLLGKIRRNRISPAMLRWAQTVKAANLAFGARLIVPTTQVRNQLRNIGVERVETFADVLPLANGTQSFIGSLVLNTTKNGGARQLALADDRFYEAIMGNPHLRNFFLGLLHYIVSASRAWTTQNWNLDPVAHRDDYSDLGTLLYVGDVTDRVVSEDRQLERRVIAVVPGIRVSSANDL
jgi:hypothetical protein